MGLSFLLAAICCLPSVFSAAAAGGTESRLFGTGRQDSVAEMADGFIAPLRFFTDYVTRRLPVVMRGAAADWDALRRWTDDYLMELLLEAPDPAVRVYLAKREEPVMPQETMSFLKFIAHYNDSDYYLVNQVPRWLRKDVTVPWPLQCDIANKVMAMTLLWMSSGNTVSMAHQDLVDNIHCVIDGRKDVILADNVKYKGAFPMYNALVVDLDVDNIDLTKHPQISKVSYLRTSLNAGDCLYIPSKFVHQVRSFERNIGIAFYFNGANKVWSNIKFEKDCEDHSKKNFTLDVLNNSLRDSLYLAVEIHSKLNISTIFDILIPHAKEHVNNVPQGYRIHVLDALSSFDENRDGCLNNEEIKAVPQETWNLLDREYQHFVHSVKQEYHANLIRDEL